MRHRNALSVILKLKRIKPILLNVNSVNITGVGFVELKFPLTTYLAISQSRMYLVAVEILKMKQTCLKEIFLNVGL